MSIFTITDIDSHLINFLKVKDLISLSTTNSYYYNIVTGNKLYNVGKKFIENKDKIDTCITLVFNDSNKPKVQEELFLKSCSFGDLEIVRYIISQYDIDVYRLANIAFGLARRSGRVDVCLFLLSVKIESQFKIF